MIRIPIKLRAILFVFFLAILSYSCNKESNALVDGEDDETETETEATACNNPLEYVFGEKDGLVVVEFENAEFSEDWKLKNDGNSHTGDGYMVWEGSQHLGNPGNGTSTFKIKIAKTGTYQFIWHSAVKTGNNGTDHNDTWLRFNDAADFYGQNSDGSSKVYPAGIGKTPNPEGATADGWFKIYRSGNDLDFKWQASTFDNNGHNIYVKFDNPGTYLMEVSARSSGHAIDKFVLFDDSISKADAIASTVQSSISCN